MSDLEPLLADLRRCVEPERITVDHAARATASRDYAWMSPILRTSLPDRLAEVVVRPRVIQVADVLAVAHRHRIAVTPRGKGTGNYGQAVPLEGGLVIDLADCATVRSIGVDDDGLPVADVEAGVTFATLERVARTLGFEVAVMPSMIGSTVGGFLSGGNQGIGSIAHGSLWDGWIRELDIAGCGSRPATFTVNGAGAGPHLHTYGTTGIVTGARLGLSAAVERTVVFAAFDGLAAAAAAGRATMDLEPAPRVVSVDDVRIADVLPAHEGIVEGRVILRVEIGLAVESVVSDIVAVHGGTVTAADPTASAALYASVYNHAALRALRADPDVCSLQVRGPAIVERLAEVRDVLPEVRLHLDGNAPAKHGKGFSGLLLSRWVDSNTLDEAIRRLTDLGVSVISPHSWMLGGHGDLDVIRSVAETIDPASLLNPGKLPPRISA